MPGSIVSRIDTLSATLDSMGKSRIAGTLDIVANTIESVPAARQAQTPSSLDIKVTNIAFFGGVHGDETPGILLINELKANPNLVDKPGLSLSLNLGNPAGISRGVRYNNMDMNRCFSLASLSAEPCCPEAARAQEIFRDLGGRKGVVDLLVDFHSTVCSMGLTFIVSRTDPFICRMVGWLLNKHAAPDVHVLYTAEDQDSSPYLDSLGKSGLTVEVGPLGKGLLPSQDQYDRLRAVAMDIMDFVNCWNDGIYSVADATEIPVYRYVQTVKYDVDPQSGQRVTDVYPGLVGKDFQSMKKGDPMQVDLRTGAVTAYEGDRVVWPVFICETASTYRDPRFGNQAMDLTWLSNEKW